LKKIIFIILAAVVFGGMMGYRAGLSFGWQRALIAALAFIILGLLVSYLVSRRK
jgi:ABC-type antimicrobial peptide transport system permease subunit